MSPEALYLDSLTWADSAAALVMASVREALANRGKCTVMLTGGRSAARLYLAWAAMPAFSQLRQVNFYFGDERCVPANHPESNFGMAMGTLFRNGVPDGCAVFRMFDDHPERSAARYEQELPDALDVLLLSVGADGHIASLFPHSEALHEARKRVIPVLAPKPPCQRLTVTPVVLAQAAQAYVMALGAEKAAVFKRARSAPEAFDDLPARMVLNATWILDTRLRE